MTRHVSEFPPTIGAAGLPRRLQFAILGAVAAVAILAVVVLPGLLGHGGSPEAALAPPPVGAFRATDAQWAALRMAPVRTMTFRAEQETDGKIATNDDTTTPAFSPFSGRVTKIFAKAGDTVKKGDPLLTVEASEYVQGQNDLITAVAGVTMARAQLNLTETAEKRQHELYDAKGGALKDWQQAEVDLANARGATRTAEIALAAVRNRLRILGKSDQEIGAIERAPESRMAAEAVVRAPIGGTVIQRQVGIGQYINSASGGAANPVFAIGDLSTVWLVANVREADAPTMKVGQAVEVRVLAYPGRVFHARLAYVAAAIDPNTRRLTVRAEVENGDGALKPEMFARFSILTGAEAAAPAVAEDAVVREGEGARVWVADPAGKTLALRQIHTGQSSDGMVEVTDGLHEGETVVTSGALFIDRAAKTD